MCQFTIPTLATFVPGEVRVNPDFTLFLAVPQPRWHTRKQQQVHFSSYMQLLASQLAKQVTSDQAKLMLSIALLKKWIKQIKKKQCSNQSSDMQLATVVLWSPENGICMWFVLLDIPLYQKQCLQELPFIHRWCWQHWCGVSRSHRQEFSHQLCVRLHTESHFANKGWVDGWEFLKMLVPVDFQSCSGKLSGWDWIYLEEFCLPNWNQWWSFRGREVSRPASCQLWMKSGSSCPPFAEEHCSN